VIEQREKNQGVTDQAWYDPHTRHHDFRTRYGRDIDWYGEGQRSEDLSFSYFRAHRSPSKVVNVPVYAVQRFWWA
jgi:hypothetical protein